VTAEPHELVRAVAGYGLPGTPETLERASLPDSLWAELLHLVRVQRVTGFLIQAVRDDALPARADQATEAALAHRAEMSWALLIEGLLLDTAHRLTDSGVAFRVLKGSTAAHLDYPSPELRSFGDVDLLVRSEQFDTAVAVLTAAGHRRRFPQPRPGFDRRFSKGTSFIAEGGKEIDLHRTFVMGSFGLTIKLDDLWARSSSYLVGDVVVHGLAREERFLNACFHSTLGDHPARLAALRDVAQLLLGGHLDLHLVRALAASWRSDVVVARALQLAWRAFDLDAAASPLSAWALDYDPNLEERRALAAYTDPEGGYAARSAAGLRAVPGLRDKAAYLGALVFPARDYVEPRYRGRVDRWRRGAAAVLRRGERP
jgi:hypothetical protein